MAIADLVSTLAKHDVEFIIVGRMAAILRGTPVNTFVLAQYAVMYTLEPSEFRTTLRAASSIA
jgi:hypothetical protein